MVNEWTYAPLRSICTKIQDGTHFSPSANGGDYLYITSRNIGFGKFDLSGAQRIDKAQHEEIYKRCDVKPGDLLLTKDGANTGNAVINPLTKEFSLLSSVAFLRFDPNAHDARFYLQQILSSDGQRQIKEAMTGNAITRLTLDKIGNLSFMVIPLSEQHRIATVLSDMDAYIFALEKLINKKRSIKKGAMQELLTGKRRLPGFEGEWMEKSLRKILRVGHGRSQSGIETESGQYPILASGGEIGRTNSYLYDRPSVLIGRKGTIDKPQYQDTPFWSIDTLFYTEINDEAFPKYVYYLFCLIDWARLSEASGVPSLSASIIETLRVVLPKQPEQIAIAAVLSDMDAEIDVLTAKLNKARCIKQGMMQELLSGRIRLLDNVSTEVKPIAKVIKMPKREAKAASTKANGHSQQFDDAVMIAGIVNALYSEKYPLGRKKVQKCLYLLRRYQDESTAAFKKKAAGPYADEVRYKGGEPIAKKANYIITTTVKGKGTTFARGSNIEQALGYIVDWGKQADIRWLIDKIKYEKVDELELLATVDMAICDLAEVGTPISVVSIKHLIAINKEWADKLAKPIFSDGNIARAIEKLPMLLQGGN